ncbi:MAG: RES family NAD+ phosphorylase [Opitutales bacterium]|nr:RES family NAD+ phosphorylase [Opitutales bacterium]
MPQAWCIVPQNRSQKAFDGEGARLYGGRWNSPGQPAVYLGGSRALAALELLVHLNPARQRITYLRFAVAIPNNLIDHLDPKKLPQHFGKSCSTDPLTQTLGDKWLRACTRPSLRIPSAIIPEESNYLLNPQHPDFPLIKISPPEPFAFDPRLITSSQ